MRIGKIVCMATLGIFVIAQLSYAHSAMVNLAQPAAPESDQTKRAVDGAVKSEQENGDRDATSDPNAKGSPMHAWLAIVTANYRAGDFISDENFEKLRATYKKSTRGYEARSLRAAGILKRVKGGYEVLVSASKTQIENAINPAVQEIVGRIGIHGEQLGLDAHRLDPRWLGKGDINNGNEMLQKIRTAVYKITGNPSVEPEPLPYESEDFVRADITAGSVPASAVINGDMPFTVADQLVTIPNGTAVLAALVDMRLLEPQAQVRSSEAVNFEPTKVQTILFKGDFVTSDPQAFAAAYKEQVDGKTDTIAVIISTGGDEMEVAINKVLADPAVALSGELGDKIIVMGVKPESSAAIAFGKLFGDKGMITDLQTAKDILNNKVALEALGGAV